MPKPPRRPRFGTGWCTSGTSAIGCWHGWSANGAGACSCCCCSVERSPPGPCVICRILRLPFPRRAALQMWCPLRRSMRTKDPRRCYRMAKLPCLLGSFTQGPCPAPPARTVLPTDRSIPFPEAIADSLLQTDVLHPALMEQHWMRSQRMGPQWLAP